MKAKNEIITLLLLALIATAISVKAQNGCYWVFFTDKSEVQFNPHTYFDQRAIDRYERNGASLYDETNLPLNQYYVNAVNNLSDETIGASRWFNAVGVSASPENIELIRRLPFVREVRMIMSGMDAASLSETSDKEVSPLKTDSQMLSNQLNSFEGEIFVKKGINGKGIRVAVFDAGFPEVDKHVAFKHLRDNGQIIKTYNFPLKKENVYGWNSHGTMVLSCIAGIEDNKLLGLATGSEFLLARTEVAAEPFKEEIWWMQAVEWADKNGVDVINSSLGYGKERYYSKDMNGTSLVAQAANLAARKGMLVCCSAGNEGSSAKWKTIVTPADADSVLTVGGITDDKAYRHINFSSYGPTADGRMKPNVCAFGEARVASPSSSTSYTFAQGTSFSSPLVAGFVACAWQTRPELTAMQLKAEVERSSDLYPYYDYAFGYGVPQADFFSFDSSPDSLNDFYTLEQNADTLTIHFLNKIGPDVIFINYQDPDGKILNYYQMVLDDNFSDIKINKHNLPADTKINISYAGVYENVINNVEGKYFAKTKPLAEGSAFALNRNQSSNQLKNEHKSWAMYYRTGLLIPNNTWNCWDLSGEFGVRYFYGTKRYQPGLGLAVGRTDMRNKNKDDDYKMQYSFKKLKAAFVQRFVFVPAGLNLDLSAYAEYNYANQLSYHYNNLVTTCPEGNVMTGISDEVKIIYKNCDGANPLQYGVEANLNYSIMGVIRIGVWGNYRFSDLVEPAAVGYNPQKISIGLEAEISL